MPIVPPALEESSLQKGAESESSAEENTAGDDVVQRHQLPRRLLRAESVLRHIQTRATEPGGGSRNAVEKFKAGVI